MRDIQPEDIELLTRELNLKETTPTTLEALTNSFSRENWFAAFRAMRNGAMMEAMTGRSSRRRIASQPGRIRRAPM